MIFCHCLPDCLGNEQLTFLKSLRQLSNINSGSTKRYRTEEPLILIPKYQKHITIAGHISDIQLEP